MTLLAKEVAVSQPTVMRFVKAIGYDSFKQFKLELAKNYDKENNIDILFVFSINADDKIMDLPGKIVATATSMLENALKSLSLVNYQKTVALINQSQHISIYAVENSMGVAHDLMTKLIYYSSRVIKIIFFSELIKLKFPSVGSTKSIGSPSALSRTA